MLKSATSSALAMGALVLGLVNAAAAQTCVPVQGKILNNFAAEDGSATQGVVAMEYGPKGNAIKLKCALVGQAYGPPSAGFISFIHSISCDDAISVPAGDGFSSVPVHSSIVLFTSGTTSPAADPTGPILFTFVEKSVPLVGAPARGLFLGVDEDPTKSWINVQGAVYKAPYLDQIGNAVPGSIDMKFTGQFCKAG
jgi:hypothetical protein